MVVNDSERVPFHPGEDTDPAKVVNESITTVARVLATSSTQ